MVGPEVAALPQVLGEMTLLIRLHQTCGQDSVGWARKAAYGAHGLVSKGVALIGAVWDVFWLRPVTRWLQQSAKHMLSFGRVFTPACSRFALVQGRAGVGRIRPVCISLC